MKAQRETLYDIPVNEKLLWDYDWSETDYKTDKFFKWYLARVLSNGTANDLRKTDFGLIKKYLNRLIGISRSTKCFWMWYLGM